MIKRYLLVLSIFVIWSNIIYPFGNGINVSGITITSNSIGAVVSPSSVRSTFIIIRKSLTYTTASFILLNLNGESGPNGVYSNLPPASNVVPVSSGLYTTQVTGFKLLNT